MANIFVGEGGLGQTFSFCGRGCDWSNVQLTGSVLCCGGLNWSDLLQGLVTISVGMGRSSQVFCESNQEKERTFHKPR